MPKRRRPTIKDLEGSISVQGDVTPISRQPVEQILADQWPTMSLVDLWEQRRIMSNRIGFAQSGNLDIIRQLEMGMRRLDAIIAEKTALAEDNDESYLI